MDLGLHNLGAVITGGSHGIGREIALTLASEGVNILFCGRDQNRIRAVEREILAKKVKCCAIQADLTSAAGYTDFVDAINTWDRRIFILVNNVGGGGRWGSESTIQTNVDIWEKVLSKNFSIALRLTYVLLPKMCSQRGGRVITISSIHGSDMLGRPWYSVAKASQNALMQSLAKDKQLVRSGITFNSVAPGPIMIPDTGWDAERKKSPDDFWQKTNDLVSGGLGDPSDVANIVVFLCSERAKHINGAVIPVDGGGGIATISASIAGNNDWIV